MSRTPSVILTARRIGAWGAIWLVAGAALAAGSAQAQSASGTLSSYRTGYGGAGLSGLESPVNLSLISSGSQFTVSDGVNQAGSVGSVFATSTSSNQTSASSQTSSSQTTGGASQSYSGVGQLATSNQRVPVAITEGMSPNAAAHQGVAAPHTQAGPAAPTASAGASAPAQGPAPNEMVLNGQINLDGGQ